MSIGDLVRKATRHNPDYTFLLFLADLHTLHVCGMAPPDFTASTGSKLNLNEGQEYLWECHQHLLDHLPKHIDGLFLVGDICEGQNPAEDARHLSEVDPIFQVRAAHQVLSPIASRVKAIDGQRNIYLARGSKYHAGRGAALEEQLGEMLGTHQKGPYYSAPWWKVMVGGVLFDVAHRQSYTIRYSAMPLEREWGFLLERKGRRREVLPEMVVIVRAHTHKGFRVWREQGVLCISLPAMKLQDDFAQSSISPNRLFSDNLGAVGIKIYKEPVNNERVHVLKYLFDHPEDDVEVMPL